MRSLIITGDLEKRERYVEEFATSEKIPAHSITIYSDEIRVLEARAIRKDLSNKYSTKRLIVLKSKLNLVAQNLLLKSFEELPDNVAVIISQNDLSEIIDTIKSRFFIVNLENIDNSEKLVSLDGIFSDGLANKILAVDRFLNGNKEMIAEQQIDMFVRSYRRELLERVIAQDIHTLKEHVDTLKRLLSVSNFVKFNNLNLRLGLENAIL